MKEVREGVGVAKDRFPQASQVEGRRPRKTLGHERTNSQTVPQVAMTEHPEEHLWKAQP